MGGFIAFLIIIGLFIVLAGVRIINQYRTGRGLSLGKVRPMRKEPGQALIIP